MKDERGSERGSANGKSSESVKRSEDAADAAAEVAVVTEAGTEAEAPTDVAHGTGNVSETERGTAVLSARTELLIGTETDFLTTGEAEALIGPDPEALIVSETEAQGTPETGGVVVMMRIGVVGKALKEARGMAVQVVKELLLVTGIATEILAERERVTAAERSPRAVLVKAHDSAALAGLTTASRDFLIAAETRLLVAVWTGHTAAVLIDGGRTASTGTAT